MKRSARPPRTPSSLSESSHHHLNMYALAAGAAGVGMLALAQPAEAKIVYTPANIHIVFNQGNVFLDLNHDGVNDFAFYGHSARTTSGFSAFLDGGPAQPRNAAWWVASGRHECAVALPKGIRIGSKRPFKSDNLVMFDVSSTAGGKGTNFCPWGNGLKSAYLGLKFSINGKTHFGWARVAFTSVTTVTGYAYETIPGKPILSGRMKGPDESSDLGQSGVTPGVLAPEASLGLLAMGAPSLAIWRREEHGGTQVNHVPDSK